MFKKIKNLALTPRLLFWMVFLFLFTLKTHRTFSGQGDEPSYIIIAESLLLDGDLDLRNNHESPRLKKVGDPHVVVMEDGRWMPFHSIGLPILGLPVLALAYGVTPLIPPFLQEKMQTTPWHMVKNFFAYFVMFLTAWLAVAIHKLLRVLLNNNSPPVWWFTFLLCVSPPLLSYGYLFFPAIPTALILVLIFNRLARSEPQNIWNFILIGILPWLSPRNYSVTALLFPILAYEWKKGSSLDIRQKPNVGCRDLTPFLIRAVVLLFFWGGFLASVYSIWGTLSPINAVTDQVQGKTFDWKWVPIALPGLYFDRGFGLFVFTPILMLFPAGLAILWSKAPRMTLYFLIILVANHIPLVAYYFWWGGWCPATRFLAMVGPIYVVGTAVVLVEGWKIKSLKNFLKPAVILTALMALLYWQKPKLMWNYEDGVNRFLTYWLGPVGEKLQVIWPSFFQAPPQPQLLFLVWVLVLVGINFWMWKKILRTTSNE